MVNHDQAGANPRRSAVTASGAVCVVFAERHDHVGCGRHASDAGALLSIRHCIREGRTLVYDAGGPPAVALLLFPANMSEAVTDDLRRIEPEGRGE